MRQIIIFSIIVLMAGCKMSSDTIATIGNQKITKSEFNDMLARRHAGQRSAQKISIEEKKNILNQMLEQRMKIEEALNAGYKDSVMQSNRYKFYMMRMEGQAFFNHYVKEALVPEKDVKNYFEKQKELIDVAHVLIGFKGSRIPHNRSKEEALALAQKISRQAQAGKNFRVLTTKYSDDPSVKKNYGEIGAFSWGELAPSFQDTAFAMQAGQISGPVLTVFGYHVIKLLKKVPNPRWKEENFPKEIYSIREDLFKQQSDSARKLWKRVLEEKSNEYHLSLNNAGIVAMSKACLDLQKQGKLDQGNFSKEQNEIVVAQWDGKTLTLQDVLPFYGTTLDRAASLLTSEPKLGADLSRKVNGAFVAFLAEKEKLLDDAASQKKITNFLNSNMVNLLEKHEVSNKIKMTTGEKEDYYLKHKSEFILPAKIELWEITAKDKAAAMRIYKKAIAGANFKSLAQKYSTNKLFAKRGGYIGFRAIKARGVVSQEAFKAGPYKILKPLLFNKKWAVVKTGDLKEPIVRSYEDVANQVRIKLRQVKIRARRKAWKNELFEKHPYKINEEALEAI